MKFIELLPCCHCNSRYPQHPNNKEFWQIESQYMAFILRTEEHRNKAMNITNIFILHTYSCICTGIHAHNKHFMQCSFELCLYHLYYDCVRSMCFSSSLLHKLHMLCYTHIQNNYYVTKK
jgi:hypothetical protein